VPRFLVEIHGNAHRAMGLLAVAGVQNLVSRQEPTKRVMARLSSENAEVARRRVLAALRGEAFTVDPGRREG
jgi:hypothetical protein